MCMCVCASICMLVKTREQSWVLLLRHHLPFGLRQDLDLAWSLPSRLEGWTGSCRVLLSLPFWYWNYKCCVQPVFFFFKLQGIPGIELSPHACKVCALLTEQSTQPLYFNFCWFRRYHCRIILRKWPVYTHYMWRYQQAPPILSFL